MAPQQEFDPAALLDAQPGGRIKKTHTAPTPAPQIRFPERAAGFKDTPGSGLGCAFAKTVFPSAAGALAFIGTAASPAAPAAPLAGLAAAGAVSAIVSKKCDGEVDVTGAVIDGAGGGAGGLVARQAVRLARYLRGAHHVRSGNASTIALTLAAGGAGVATEDAVKQAGEIMTDRREEYNGLQTGVSAFLGMAGARYFSAGWNKVFTRPFLR